jgi:hypothetical protein
MEAKEKSAQFLDNFSARSFDEHPDNCFAELPFMETQKLSAAARGNTIVIHFGVLIEDGSHLLVEA